MRRGRINGPEEPRNSVGIDVSDVQTSGKSKFFRDLKFASSVIPCLSCWTLKTLAASHQDKALSISVSIVTPSDSISRGRRLKGQLIFILAFNNFNYAYNTINYALYIYNMYKTYNIIYISFEICIYYAYCVWNMHISCIFHTKYIYINYTYKII